MHERIFINFRPPTFTEPGKAPVTLPSVVTFDLGPTRRDGKRALVIRFGPGELPLEKGMVGVLNLQPAEPSPRGFRFSVAVVYVALYTVFMEIDLA